MAFTLMPNGPSVFARDLVRATQEILRAGVLIAVPGVRPAPPLMLMMRPQPACFMYGARAAIVTEKFFFEVSDDLLVGDYLHVVGDGAADTGGAVGEDVDSTQGLGSLSHESFD